MKGTFWLPPKKGKSCICQLKKYEVPVPENYGELLQYSRRDQKVLAVFEIDVGPFERSHNGYRKRVKPFTLYIKCSVDDKINAIADENRKRKLRNKFPELLGGEEYRNWYDYTLMKIAEGKKNIPYYEVFKMKYVKMAIWPLLYVKKEFCESAIDGNESRLSAKKSFHAKCLSSIMDFSQDFELLQYQYDRWL